MFLLEAAVSKGTRMVQGKASSMSSEKGRVIQICVTCTEGSILTLPCDRLLIAAGPWTGPLSDSLLPTRIPIEPYAGHSVILRPSTATSPHSLFVTLYGQRSYRAEVVPRSSGDIYISGVNDTLTLPPTPDLAIPRKTEIDKLKEVADAILPSYTVVKEQLGFRPMTEHGKPYICPYPEVDGVFVGAGHGHFGIILGTGTGKVLSEMILGDELSVDVSQFSL
jgi:glycine/D-amino acid oxidase-like deaminating enzyme